MNIKSSLHITIILGLSLLFFGSGVYAIDCKAPGREKPAGTETRNYTCELASNKSLRGAEGKEAIAGPCKDAGPGRTNTRPEGTCYSNGQPTTYTICHICKKIPGEVEILTKDLTGEVILKLVPKGITPLQIEEKPQLVMATRTVTENGNYTLTGPGGESASITVTTISQDTSSPPASPGKVCAEKAGEQLINGKCYCVPKPGICCGVKLNTSVPFIGRCITTLSKEKRDIVKEYIIDDPDTLIIKGDEAFPRLMLGLTKILVTVILLASFGGIIVAGVMIAASGTDDTTASKGRQLIGSVVVGLALLGASGVILRLINPNFFG